jgi:hypothetical protein
VSSKVSDLTFHLYPTASEFFFLTSGKIVVFYITVFGYLRASLTIRPKGDFIELPGNPDIPHILYVCVPGAFIAMRDITVD